MRGADDRQGSMFSYGGLDDRVPADPLRAIRRITDRALERLSPEFRTLYKKFGRPSIPPERCCAHCCCRRCTDSPANAS